MVQVELRDRTSILPSLSAWKRASAESGTSRTRLGSSNTAAATAWQKSTSKPDHLPRSSTSEKPGRPSLTPQRSAPRARTAASVCPAAPSAASAEATATAAATKDRSRPHASLICPPAELQRGTSLDRDDLKWNRAAPPTWGVRRWRDAVQRPRPMTGASLTALPAGSTGQLARAAVGRGRRPRHCVGTDGRIQDRAQARPSAVSDRLYKARSDLAIFSLRPARSPAPARIPAPGLSRARRTLR